MGRPLLAVIAMYRAGPLLAAKLAYPATAVNIRVIPGRQEAVNVSDDGNGATFGGLSDDGLRHGSSPSLNQGRVTRNSARLHIPQMPVNGSFEEERDRPQEQSCQD